MNIISYELYEYNSFFIFAPNEMGMCVCKKELAKMIIKLKYNFKFTCI